MAPGRPLQKNVRPLPVDDYLDNVEASSGEDSDEPDSESVNAIEEDVSNQASASEDDNDGEYGGEETDEKSAKFAQQIANVSFGTLLEAKNALSKKRKRDVNDTAEQDAKVETMRLRRQQAGMEGPVERVKPSSKIKGRQPASSSDPANESSQLSQRERNDSAVVDIQPTLKSVPDIPERVSSGNRFARNSVNRDKQSSHRSDPDEAEESESAPSEEEVGPKSRSSKHAPASQSSKRQVTRKRTVIDVPKRTSRDPRFDGMHANSAHTGNSEKAYSFLQDYRKAEIAELKAAIKQVRSEEDKETLKRQMVSMENRMKAKEAKEREQEVLRQHRKEEREKVEGGKTPFFLKRKDLKEKALVEKFKGMKSKDREKLIERRRKKESQKEKKRMPNARRLAG